MKIQQYIQKLVRKSRGDTELPNQVILRLISRLESTFEQEFSCDEVFALVDDYAEAYLHGEDVAHLKPLIRQHLDMCRECEEEYEALLQVLEGTASS